MFLDSIMNWRTIQCNFFFPLAATNSTFLLLVEGFNLEMFLETYPWFPSHSSWLRIFCFCSQCCFVLFFNPQSRDMSVFPLTCNNVLYDQSSSFWLPASESPGWHCRSSHLLVTPLFQTRRKPLSYLNTFLFVWLTCKECALVSVFGRQNRDWALKLSLHLKWALNTDFTMCSCS